MHMGSPGWGALHTKSSLNCAYQSRIDGECSRAQNEFLNN